MGNHTEQPSTPPDPPTEMGPGCPHREPLSEAILTLFGSLSSSFSLPSAPWGPYWVRPLAQRGSDTLWMTGGSVGIFSRLGTLGLLGMDTLTP